MPLNITKSSACSFALAVGLTAMPVLAQEDPGLPPPRPLAPSLDAASSTRVAEPPETSWYGWQMLIGFGASDAFLLGSVGTSQAGGAANATMPLLAAGLAGHALTAPVTHWAHGHVGKGFASLGLTLGAGIAAGATGFALGAATGGTGCGNGGSFCFPVGPVFGAMVGAGVGVVAMNLVDAFVLGREVPRESDRGGAISLAPIVDAHSGGLAVLGKF
jgi:hypothetical protein